MLKKKTFKFTGYYNENYKISSDIEYIFKLINEKNLVGDYLSDYSIKMKLGGLSTKSLKNIVFANFECYIALKNLKIGSIKSIIIVVQKVLRKLMQIN